MNDRLVSNSLPIKADAIRSAIAESDAAHLTSIEKALEAGRLLVEAKAECKYGEWLPFLERAGVHERKARRYMKLAESGLKSDRVSDLGGITAALKLLSRRKLPAQGKCLEITAKQRGVITAIGCVWPSIDHAGFYYCAAMQHPIGEGSSSPVVWTKRPVRGEPIMLGDGEVYEPVWQFFETHMGAPTALWEFEEDGVMPEVLAFTLDLPWLVSEAEHNKEHPDGGSHVVADFLESIGVTPHYRDWGAAT